MPIGFNLPSPLKSLTPSRSRQKRPSSMSYQTGWWIAPRSPVGDTPKPKPAKSRWVRKKKKDEVRV